MRTDVMSLLHYLSDNVLKFRISEKITRKEERTFDFVLFQSLQNVLAAFKIGICRENRIDVFLIGIYSDNCSEIVLFGVDQILPVLSFDSH